VMIQDLARLYQILVRASNPHQNPALHPPRAIALCSRLPEDQLGSVLIIE
jgi:hypothetical protein